MYGNEMFTQVQHGSFGGEHVASQKKKTRPRSSGNLLASPERWGPLATVRDQWRDSDNPERSHELWNLNAFSEARNIRNTLEYMGWVVVNGVYRFQVSWPTLDEIFGGSTTYYRMNLPTLSGNLKTWSCLIWNYVVCCDLLGVNKYSPPPHIHAQLVCVLSLPKSQELNPGSPANNWPLVLKTQRTGSGNGSGKRWMEKKIRSYVILGSEITLRVSSKVSDILWVGRCAFHVGIRDVFRRYLQV